MQHMSLQVLCCWAIYTAAEAFVLLIMGRSGAVRRWPSLFAFVGLNFTRDLVCWLDVLLWKSPSVYFWGYWYLTPAATLAEVWLIVQVAQRVAGINDKLRVQISRGIYAYSLAAFVSILWLAFNAPASNPVYPLVYIAQTFELAISLAIAVVLLTFLCATRALSIQWSRGVRGIAFGLFLESFSNELSAAFHFANFWTNFIDIAKGAVEILTLGLWAAFIFRSTAQAIEYESFIWSRSNAKGAS